jgi:hypothetical protein
MRASAFEPGHHDVAEGVRGKSGGTMGERPVTVPDPPAGATYLLREHAGPVAHLMEKHRGQRMQMADACLVRMSEVKRDCRVFTLDKDEFRIYRRFERQVIPLIVPA